MATVDQKLVRDLTMLLQTRGIRLASRNAATNTDAFKVYAAADGDTLSKDLAIANATFLVIEIDTDKLADLSDDKAFGAEDMIVPDPDRV